MWQKYVKPLASKFAQNIGSRMDEAVAYDRGFAGSVDLLRRSVFQPFRQAVQGD